MVFDTYDNMDQDILKAMYLQLLLQISIRDLRASYREYAHFAKKNRQFMRKIECGMHKVGGNYTMKQLIKDMNLFVFNSTFSLFADESKVALHIIKTTNKLIEEYKDSLSFDFRGLKENGKDLLLIPDDWKCSSKFLNLYTPENELNLEKLLLCETPIYNFKKNLTAAEKFIEKQTTIKIGMDKQLEQYFGKIKFEIGGIISPRNPLSYTNQQQYFIFNRMNAIVAYRDMLREQSEFMIKQYRNVDNQQMAKDKNIVFGSVGSALEFADKLIAEYHNFYNEPTDDNSLFEAGKDVYKHSFDVWYEGQVEYADNETSGLVHKMYLNNCDNYASLDNVKKELQYSDYHLA